MIARAFDAKGGPALHETIYRLPANRVFEDLLPRRIDLDQDGRDEIVLVESDSLRGSSLVVLGCELRAAAQAPPRHASLSWHAAPTWAAAFAGSTRQVRQTLTAMGGWILPLSSHRTSGMNSPFTTTAHRD